MRSIGRVAVIGLAVRADLELATVNDEISRIVNGAARPTSVAEWLRGSRDGRAPE